MDKVLKRTKFNVLHLRVQESAHRDGDLVYLVLAGGQAGHPGPVLLLDGVVLPQLPEHLVHALETRSLVMNINQDTNVQ